MTDIEHGKKTAETLLVAIDTLKKELALSRRGALNYHVALTIKIKIRILLKRIEGDVL